MSRIEGRIRDAQGFIDGGNPTRAIKVLQEVQPFTSGEQRVRLHQLLANAHRNTGGLGEANYHMERAHFFAALLPPSREHATLAARLYRDHAYLLLELNKVDAAIKKVMEALNLEPQRQEYGATLGAQARCMEVARDLPEARRLFAEAHQNLQANRLWYETMAAQAPEDEHLADMARQCRLYMLNNLIHWLRVLPVQRQLTLAPCGIELALKFNRPDRIMEILVLIAGGAPLHTKWKRLKR